MVTEDVRTTSIRSARRGHTEDDLYRTAQDFVLVEAYRGELQREAVLTSPQTEYPAPVWREAPQARESAPLRYKRTLKCSTSRTSNRIVRELGGSGPSVHRRDLSAFTVSKGYDPRAGRRRRTTNR